MFKKLFSAIHDLTVALSLLRHELFKLSDVTTSNKALTRETVVYRDLDYYYKVEIQYLDSSFVSFPLNSLTQVNEFLASHVYQKQVVNIRIAKIYDDGR